MRAGCATAPNVFLPIITKTRPKENPFFRKSAGARRAFDTFSHSGFAQAIKSAFFRIDTARKKIKGEIRMLSKKLTVLLTVIGLSFIFSQAARSQEKDLQTEFIVSSDTLWIWLPSGAEKITQETVPAELKHKLSKVVAETAGAHYKQYNPQFLVWRGAEYKESGDGQTIVENLSEKITKMEYRFTVGKTANGVTAFRIDDEAMGKTVVGFYQATGDGFFWSWTQVYADEK
jgi:hypothetical protein